MFTLANRCLVFVLAISTLVLSGFAIKIDSYEQNQLINLNNENYSRLVLTNESFGIVRPKKGGWFKYYCDGVEYSRRITQIENRDDRYVIILNGRHDLKSLENISYRVGKNTIWTSLFS